MIGGAVVATARVLLHVDGRQVSEGMSVAKHEVSAGTDSMVSHLSRLEVAQEKVKLSQESYTRAVARYGAEDARARRQLVALSEAEIHAGQAARVAAMETERAGVATGRYARNARHAQGESGRMNRAHRESGGIARTMGRAFAFASTALIGGAGFVYAGKLAIGTAMGFQGAMKLLYTSAGASTGEMHRMTAAVLKLAPAVGRTPQELAHALFFVESAGYRGKRALQALRISAMGARLGHADLTKTTDALVGAMKSGIPGVQNLGKAMGSLNAIVGSGKMTMDDLVGALTTGILPKARAYGLTLRDVGAALAVMTDAGVPAQQASTRLGMTFALLATQSPKAEKALASIGIGSKQLAIDMREHGLLYTLQDLQQHMAGLSKVDQTQLLSKVFGGGKTSGTVLMLLQQLDNLKKKQDAISDGGRKFGQQWKVASHSAGMATDRLKAAVDVLAVYIGNALLPTVTRYANRLADWASKSKNQAKIQHAVKATLHDVGLAMHVVIRVLHVAIGTWKVFAHAVGGSSHAIKILIAAFIAWKAVKIGASIIDTTSKFGKLGTGVGKVGKAFGKTRIGAKLLSSGLLGKAGIVGAAGVAAFALTTLILHLTGADKWLRKVGSSAYDLAAKLHLIHDPMAKFKGKPIRGQKATFNLRQEAARLEQRGMSPQQAADKLVAEHPDLAQHDADVFAGVYGDKPVLLTKAQLAARKAKLDSQGISAFMSAEHGKPGRKKPGRKPPGSGSTGHKPPAKPPPPGPLSKFTTTIPDRLQLALSRAQYQGDVKAQIAALKAEQAFLQRELALARTPGERRDAYDALSGIKDEIAALVKPKKKPTTSTSISKLIDPDLIDARIKAQGSGSRDAIVKADRAEKAAILKRIRRGVTPGQKIILDQTLASINRELRGPGGGSGGGSDLTKLVPGLGAVLTSISKARSAGNAGGVSAGLRREEDMLENVLKTNHKLTQAQQRKIYDTLTAIHKTLKTQEALTRQQLSTLEKQFLAEQSSFFASFASNVFTQQTGAGGSVQRSPGSQRPTVIVNQHFKAPTTDRHREARYARHATMAAYDS